MIWYYPRHEKTDEIYVSYFNHHAWQNSKSINTLHLTYHRFTRAPTINLNIGQKRKDKKRNRKKKMRLIDDVKDKSKIRAETTTVNESMIVVNDF